MTLTFRNVDAHPDDDVSTWPTEAVLSALERGGLSHWRRIATAIRIDPWGPVARRVEEALTMTEAYGISPLMTEVLMLARSRGERAERAEVALQIDALVRGSGLTAADFAERIGTSASRLSTYVNGTVTPSAALMIRMRRVAAAARD